MHLDIDACFNSEVGEALALLFSKNINYQLENEIAELPYFVRSDLNIVESYYRLRKAASLYRGSLVFDWHFNSVAKLTMSLQSKAYYLSLKCPFELDQNSTNHCTNIM